MDLQCLLVLVGVDVSCSTSHGSGTDVHVGVFTLLQCTDMTHRPQLEKKIFLNAGTSLIVLFRSSNLS